MLIQRTECERIVINISIDITHCANHIKDIRDKIGIGDAIRSLRLAYPFLEIKDAHDIVKQL